MIIKELISQKQHCYCLIDQNDDVWVIDKIVVQDKKLYQGQIIDDNSFEEIYQYSEYTRAKNRGFYLLNSHRYSRGMLYYKLCQHFDESACEKAVNRIEELGFLDDDDYARCLAKKYIEIKSFSSKRIVQELIKKRIETSLAQEVAEELCNEVDTQSVICDLIERKYIESIDDEKKRNKAIMSLMRKGYYYNDIKQAYSLLE